MEENFKRKTLHLNAGRLKHGLYRNFNIIMFYANADQGKGRSRTMGGVLHTVLRKVGERCRDG